MAGCALIVGVTGIVGEAAARVFGEAGFEVLGLARPRRRGPA